MSGRSSAAPGAPQRQARPLLRLRGLSIGRMLIRSAIPHDAEPLTDLHLDVWEEAYVKLVPAALLGQRRANRANRIVKWRKILGSTDSIELIAEPEGSRARLVGFVSTGAGRDEPEPGLPGLEVRALYVRAEVYGSGVGYSLLTSAIHESPAYLWVLDGNLRAIRFYERQGFLFDGNIRTEPEGVERRMVRAPS